jgi:hypothetical protein
MEPIDIVDGICRSYVHDQTDINSALLATVDGYRRSRNIAELASCSRHFDLALHSVNEWRFLRQVEAFYKKNALLADSVVCADTARQSFEAAELTCSETNRRLHDLVYGRGVTACGFGHELRRMQRYICSVLGDYHKFLGEIPRLVKVTPGATAHSNRRDSLPQLKMRMKLYASRRASKYVKALYHLFGFGPPRIKTTHTNRVELVPKNWKTDRTIACEPEGNLPLQLAFDTYAKKRMKRFGLNLSDQSANQKLARHASVHNDYVTVDFAAASDTISYNAVSLLFPVDWFEFLDDVRTPSYRGVFGDGVYAKFSSMGNGSTFAIETLIFAAACHAVGAEHFLVYGDDVIVHKDVYPAFLALTRFLGFTINSDKSFADGPFRESCGFDAYDGVDVTPSYIRQVDDRKATLSHLVNTMASLTIPGGHLEAFLLSLVKERELPLTPFQESTIAGVHVDPALARRLGILRRRSHVDSCRVYVAKTRTRNFVDSRGYYLWFLYKNEQVLFGGSWDGQTRSTRHTQTSSVPVYQHNYVRKRVCWHLPTEATPDHITWWSATLARAGFPSAG